MFSETMGTYFVDEVSFDDMTDEQATQALKAVDNYKKPMAAKDIANLVARLQIITNERGKNSADIAARLNIWIEELQAYPADVVRYVLKVHKYRFFPTLAEVLERCETEMSFRRLIEQGIKLSRLRR